MNDNGVIRNFSFLLLEKRLSKVLNDKYPAITIPIIFVVLTENHSGKSPSICKITIANRNCIISYANKTILNFLGNTLYCPPIVNSPNGNPKISNSDNIITISKPQVPIIAVIVSSPFR